MATIIYGSGDTKFDTADDFLGGTLVALQPVIKYTSPNGTRKQVIQAGGTVGVIESFTQPGDGSVWWMLTDKTFVKQVGGAFDKNIVRDSVLKNEKVKADEIAKASQARMDANDNPLYRAGKDGIPFIGDLLGNLKWVVIVILVLVLLYLLVRYKEATA